MTTDGWDAYSAGVWTQEGFLLLGAGKGPFALLFESGIAHTPSACLGWSGPCSWPECQGQGTVTALLFLSSVFQEEDKTQEKHTTDNKKMNFFKWYKAEPHCRPARQGQANGKMQFEGHSALLLKCPQGSSMWNHHDGLMQLDHKDRGQKFRILWVERTIFVNVSWQAILIFSGVSGLLSVNAPNRPLSCRAAITASWMAKITEHPGTSQTLPDPWREISQLGYDPL